MSAPKPVDPQELYNPLHNIYGLADQAISCLRSLPIQPATGQAHPRRAINRLLDIQKYALLAMRRAGLELPTGADLPEGFF